MHRFICFLIGYVLGNILTGDIVSRKACGKSAFDIGSGNPGMANVMTECGFRAGIMVLVGDLLKTVISCGLCGLILFPETGMIAAAWAGLGVTVGHNHPVWHRFRGGKGVAATCAAIFCVHPAFGLLSMIIGMLAVFASQYLTVGGILIPMVFTVIAFLWMPKEIALAGLILFLMALQRSWLNIRSIAAGTEKRVDVPGAIIKLIRKKKS